MELVAEGAVVVITAPELAAALLAVAIVALVVVLLAKIVDAIVEWWNKPAPPPPPTWCTLQMSVDLPGVGHECHYNCYSGGVLVKQFSITLPKLSQVLGKPLDTCPKAIVLP